MQYAAQSPHYKHNLDLCTFARVMVDVPDQYIQQAQVDIGDNSMWDVRRMVQGSDLKPSLQRMPNASAAAFILLLICHQGCHG